MPLHLEFQYKLYVKYLYRSVLLHPYKSIGSGVYCYHRRHKHVSSRRTFKGIWSVRKSSIYHGIKFVVTDKVALASKQKYLSCYQNGTS